MSIECEHIQAVGSRTTRWLVGVQPAASPRMRLICVPYAGVGASAFRRWRGAFAPEVEVLALQTPGRETRLCEPAFTQIGPLVAAAAAAIRPHLDRPFALFGHSVGGLIAFELARHLHATEGLAPMHLFVSAGRAPHLPPRHPAIAHLPDAEFVDAIGRRYDGIPTEVLSAPELLALLVPGLKADIALFEGYRYERLKPLACPISAFGGLEDPETTPADLAGWRQETTGPFGARLFRGGHFFLQSAHPEVVSSIAASLAGRAEGRAAERDEATPDVRPPAAAGAS